MSIIPSLIAIMMHNDRQRRMQYDQQRLKDAYESHQREIKEYDEKHAKQILTDDIQRITHLINYHQMQIEILERTLAEKLEKMGHLHE